MMLLRSETGLVKTQQLYICNVRFNMIHCTVFTHRRTVHDSKVYLKLKKTF